MNRITLHIPGKLVHTVDFPATWDELTQPELLQVCKHLIVPLSPELETTRRTAILLSILKLRTAHLRLPRHWMSQIDISDFAVASTDLLQFIFTETNRTLPPFPKLRIGFKLSYRPAPAANFDDLHVGEYEDADVFANLFAQTKEAKFLALLAASVFRPSRRYNASYKADKYEQAFLKLPAEKLMAIYTWFRGCQAQLPSLFKDLMEKSGDDKKNHDLTIFTQCIHAAAGPKNGMRHQVRALLLKELLFDMNLDAKAAKEQQRPPVG